MIRKGVRFNTGRTHFKKGFTPWNKGKKFPKVSERMKGRKLSSETKNKISLSKKGQIAWNKGLKGYNQGHIGYNKGMKIVHSASFKKGVYQGYGFKKGDKPWNSGTKGMVKAWNKGKEVPQYSKEKHWSWKGGKSVGTRSKYAPRPKPNECELCSNIGRICYDHDHATGKFRGWICVACNSMLGFAKDNQEILLKGIEYLRKHESTN